MNPDNVVYFDIYDNYLYFMATSKVYCYELSKSGTYIEANLVWDYERDEEDTIHYTSNIELNDSHIVFYPSTFDSSNIICLDRLSGLTVWEKPLDIIDGWSNNIILTDDYLISNGMYYIDSFNGTIFKSCDNASELFTIINNQMIFYGLKEIILYDLYSCIPSINIEIIPNEMKSIKPFIVNNYLYYINNNHPWGDPPPYYYSLCSCSIENIDEHETCYDSFIPDYKGAYYEFPFSFIECDNKFFIYKRMEQFNVKYPDALSILNGTTGEKYGLCQGQMLGGEAIIVNGNYYSVFYNRGHGYVTIYNIEDSDCSMDNLAYTDIFYDE